MTRIEELHDRATRGLPLSEVEHRQLDEWYTQQDNAENDLLYSDDTPQTIESLQAQIRVALAQVASMTQRIQELMGQNEELRQEVATLKQQLAKRLAMQAVRARQMRLAGLG